MEWFISTELLSRKFKIAVIALVGAVIILALLAVAAGAWAWQERARLRMEREAHAGNVSAERAQADQERKLLLLSAQEEAFRIRGEVDNELRERRAEVARQEQRAAHREEVLEKKRRELEALEQKVEAEAARVKENQSALEVARAQMDHELERVAGLSLEEARAELLAQVELELDAEVAERIARAGAAVAEEAAEKSREIIIASMQRYASEQSGEASVTVLHLPNDDLKGRIIGREGRNIRALEAATGVDVIVDDTPEAVVISGFDPVRREVARLTLEKLFSDGRIHPARIEETVTKVRADMQRHIQEAGEEACFELGITGIHPELAKLLGTLAYRHSYGQGVLAHCRETGALAGMIAAEIGYDEMEAREIGLLHDIGKAVSHEVEGNHAFAGAEILARLGRSPRVVAAVRAHHYDEEPTTIGAFILMTADAISATRPGARRETLASYIKRLERLEALAVSFDGVERAFAVQAGKELRVMVRPTQVSDDQAFGLARKLAKRIHSEMPYSGQVKVCVLRETRSVEYAH